MSAVNHLCCCWHCFSSEVSDSAYWLLLMLSFDSALVVWVTMDVSLSQQLCYSTMFVTVKSHCLLMFCYNLLLLLSLSYRLFHYCPWHFTCTVYHFNLLESSSSDLVWLFKMCTEQKWSIKVMGKLCNINIFFLL